MKRKVFGATVVALSIVVSPFAVSASAEDCTEPEMLVSSTAGRSIDIFSQEISQESMQSLWQIVTREPSYSTPLIGKVIAADQNWLGGCWYPGIGIVAGAGRGPETRSVSLWAWADEVDLTVARYSVLAYINAVPSTTTTTTTTTSTTTTTTTTTVPALDTLPPSTTSTTTSVPAEETTTTTTTAAAEQTFSVADVSYSIAQVKPASLRVIKMQRKPKCKVATVKLKNKKKVRKVICK